MSSQDDNHIHVRGPTPHHGVEGIYAELMMHEETYLFVHELTIKGASSDVKLGQGMYLVLTQRGVSGECIEKTNVSTLLHVDMRGESIASLLP